VSGAAALEKLAASEFDLVLSDIRMPDLDGPALCREATRLYPRLEGRFLFLTGDALSESTRRFLDDGRVPHLAKPFGADELHAQVRARLEAAPPAGDAPGSR
jgi:CheY-like chemotaxis protein